MSGGGKIIEKKPMVLVDGAAKISVVRYLVMDQYRPDWFDETYVYAEPQDDEPALGEAIWWGGNKEIYWGHNDSKRLKKVGYSFSAKSSGAP